MALGRFITFEGGEGAGKSTQVSLLRERLAAAGVRCLGTREPGGSPRAELIREHLLSGAAKPFGPLAEAVLFYAARRDHLDAVIRPALARGETVLSDRFSDSTAAYQGASGGLAPPLLQALDRAVVGETRPHLTLVLDVPAELGAARAKARRGPGEGAADRFEAEGLSFHARLRDAFQAIAAAEPDRCALIDGTLPPSEVAAAVWRAVLTRFPDLASGQKGAPEPEPAASKRSRVY